jgi:hypothetical protein
MSRQNYDHWARFLNSNDNTANSVVKTGKEDVSVEVEGRRARDRVGGIKGAGRR